MVFEDIFNVLNIIQSAAYYAVFILVVLPGYLITLLENYESTFSKIRKILNEKKAQNSNELINELGVKIEEIIDYIIYGSILLFISTLALVIINNILGNKINDNYDLLIYLTITEYLLLWLFLILMKSKPEKKSFKLESKFYFLGILLFSTLILGSLFDVIQPYSPQIVVFDKWTTTDNGRYDVELNIYNMDEKPIILSQIFVNDPTAVVFNEVNKIEPYQNTTINLTYEKKVEVTSIRFILNVGTGFPVKVYAKNAPKN